MAEMMAVSTGELMAVSMVELMVVLTDERTAETMAGPLAVQRASPTVGPMEVHVAAESDEMTVVLTVS